MGLLLPLPLPFPLPLVGTINIKLKLLHIITRGRAYGFRTVLTKIIISISSKN